MQERMEVLERHVSFVTGLLERLHHRRPVRGSVQQGAERFQRMVGPFLREFLEVDVLDPAAQDRYPVLRELEEHYVAGVEMDLDVLAAEAVDKGIHFAGSG